MKERANQELEEEKMNEVDKKINIKLIKTIDDPSYKLASPLKQIF